MIGTICRECPAKENCNAFGISHKLASRLMIGKSVQKTGEAFPINVYLQDIKAEGLDPKSTLEFLEKIAPHCLYLK